MNFIVVLYILTIALSLYGGYKLKVSWGRVIMLTLLPPLMVAILPLLKGSSEGAFLMALYGLLFMLPALILYAVTTLFMVKKYQLGYVAQFFTGGTIGYVVGFILSAIANKKIEAELFSFALIPMVTGAMSIVLVEYLNKKKSTRVVNETL